MKSILITGGAGFIGSNYSRYILNKYPDYKITVLDALTYAGNLNNLSDLKNNKRFSFVHGNICDEKIVDKLMKSVDVVVNFAAETHVDRSIHHAGEFIDTDIRGTYVLLEAVRQYSIERFLQISTDEVYGSIEKGSFLESDPLKPNSPYSASKAGADLLVRSYFITYNTPVIITRSSNNFGPYQYPEKLIPLFITNALDNVPVPLYGDGKNVRDWLYVLDNCSAIDLVLHRGKFGEIYNVGAGNEQENITITSTILKLLNKSTDLIKYVTDRPGHDRRYSVNIKKLTSLGWQPQKNFQQTLKETVQWYKKNENWWRKIKEQQDEYKRFYAVQYENR
jgi:dTDP-glucose 4,6-dehydratase